MTVTYFGAGSVAGSNTVDFTSTFARAQIPAAAIGQIVIATYVNYKQTASTVAVVNAPAGWQSLGGIPETNSYANGICRSWWKVVTAADCFPNYVTWTFPAAGWGTFTNDRLLYFGRFPGAVKIIGGYASENWAGSSGNFTPTLPPAGVPALGYMVKLGNYSGGSGMNVTNGWTPTNDALGPFSHVYAASPILPPQFNGTLRNGINAFWLTDIDSPHCTVFEGLIQANTGSPSVRLSVASSALPDALSNYQMVFTRNTTGHGLPVPSLLSAGPWTIGGMDAGEEVGYYIYRLDGAHINGSAVMRATETTYGLSWDVTVKCPGGGGAYQFRRGRRVHIAGAQGVSIQGR